MRLATKLILSFLLLAVLPLTWITFYSYKSSIDAFRKAVKAESGALAEGMGVRLDMLRGELAHRVERLGRFPFEKLLSLQDRKDAKIDLTANPLLSELMDEIGDAAPLMDFIEFNAEPSTSVPRQMPPSPAKSATTPLLPTPDEPNRLIIHLTPEAPSLPTPGQTGTTDAPSESTVMHIRPTMPTLPAKNALRLPSETEKQRRQAQIEQIREFQVVLEKMSDGTGRQRSSSSARNGSNAPKQESSQASRIPSVDPFAAGFSSQVRTSGGAIGTVRARFSSPEIFRSILSRDSRRQGEIPFVIDADNTLYTLRSEDQKTLEILKLPSSLRELDEQAESFELNDWIVVTRKDEGSNAIFGIARPMSEALREIRQTAIQNLGYSLGLTGLALLVIAPLSVRMTRNLETLTRGAERLAKGNLDTRVSVRSHDEIGRLAESFNYMAHELGENQKRVVEQERLRKELQMSRRIQEELLPKKPLQSGLVEIKGVSIPAREVGGDFFNYFDLPGGNVAILIGDVSGKGVAAALLMANLQATLQARLPLIPDLEKLAEHLDQEMYASTHQGAYFTLFMGIFEASKSQFRYINAGHYPQFALHGNGRTERLESTGRPLGLLPGGGYTTREVMFFPGDVLFLYTDGLVEATDVADCEFGQQRLEDILLTERIHGIDKILIQVEEKVRMHRGGTEAADDATMLALKINDPLASRISP